MPFVYRFKGDARAVSSTLRLVVSRSPPLISSVVSFYVSTAP